MSFDPLNPFEEERQESRGERIQRLADAVLSFAPKLGHDNALELAGWIADVQSHLTQDEKKEVAALTAALLKWIIRMRTGL